MEMISILSFKLALLRCSVASALVLNLTSPISSQQALNTTTAISLPDYLQPADKVIDLSLEAGCNGAASGVGLTKENCHDAVSHGIPDVTMKSVIDYGDRSVGNFDVNLPQRYISGDGRSIVDVTLSDIRKVTPYYPFGIALAASFLMAKCVVEQDPAQGGTLEGFDDSHNMKVVLKSYQPGVVCVGQTVSPDIRKSCQSMLDTMAITEAPVTFGVTKDSFVRTPYSRVSGEPGNRFVQAFGPSLTTVQADRLCVMEISTSGVRSDVASWRGFWEVGVALNGICIRKGREGFQINLGAAGGLHMELKDNRNSGGTVSSS